MRKYQGIIFAYREEPELRELTANRTAASLPFCGRYRLIDFPLSSMRNAGVLDVGVIMQRDYQSLLDHIGSGKAWDMSRRSGGLRMLPPFGLPQYHNGNYNGTMEALNAVGSYLRDSSAESIIMMLGNTAANVDLSAAIRTFEESGAAALAICMDHIPMGIHHRYLLGEDGLVKGMSLYRHGAGEGLPSLEAYIFRKDVLLDLMDRCRANNQYLFHRDAISMFLNEGGKMAVYVHEGYANSVRSVEEYYAISRDMLKPEIRHQLFCRPVRAKTHEDVSTYYAENSRSVNSLVGDDCIIEGDVENCIIFSGVHVAAGARLRDCIIMKGGEVGAGADLRYVIADKSCKFAPGSVLIGSPNLPTVVPKGSEI